MQKKIKDFLFNWDSELSQFLSRQERGEPHGILEEFDPIWKQKERRGFDGGHSVPSHSFTNLEGWLQLANGIDRRGPGSIQGGQRPGRD